MEVPMSTTRTGSAARRVRALRDRTHLLPSPGGRSEPQPADNAAVENGSDSRPGPARCWGRGSAGAMSHPYLLLAAAAAATAIAGMLLVLNAHADLLQAAFGVTPKAKGPAGGATTNTTTLFNNISNLSTDAIYILLPTVTLAGAVGGIVWAAGSRRGPTIVVGAIVAGVIGAGLKTIVQ
jgi:hypothetical protein